MQPNCDCFEHGSKQSKQHCKLICLDVLSRYGELDRANDSYKEQMAQEAALDIAIESWKSKAMSTKG